MKLYPIPAGVTSTPMNLLFTAGESFAKNKKVGVGSLAGPLVVEGKSIFHALRERPVGEVRFHPWRKMPVPDVWCRFRRLVVSRVDHDLPDGKPEQVAHVALE